MKKTIIFTLLILFVIPLLAVGNDPLISGNSDYEQGYKDGFKAGYDIGYEEGFSEGSIAGEEKGQKKGFADGKYKIYKPIVRYDYEVNIIDYSDADPIERLNSEASSYDKGFADGKREGYREGNFKGYRTGLDEAYQPAYDMGMKDGVDYARKQLLLNSEGELLTDIEQFEKAIDFVAEKKYSDARNHFNIIIMNFPESLLRSRAIYRAGYMQMFLEENKIAAQAFIKCIMDYPEAPEKFTVMIAAARLLKTLKTTDYFGFGIKTYRYKTLELVGIIINNELGLELVPEACFICGECHEAMGYMINAIEMYRKIVDEFPSSIFYEPALNKLNTIR